jgi:hypothetical protein
MIHKRVLKQTESDAVYVLVKNGSSGALANGDVVIWDATDDDGISVDTIATAESTLIAGVICESIAVGAYGRMQVYGYHSAVKIDGGTTDVAANAVIGSGNVANYAYTATAVGAVLGVALEAVASKTTGKAFIRCM